MANQTARALIWLLYKMLPLTNRVRGSYRKLRTAFFPLRFMAQARKALAINRRGKRGFVTYGTDQVDEVSKIFIISLGGVCFIHAERLQISEAPRKQN